jgi:hypothetical protein
MFIVIRKREMPEINGTVLAASPSPFVHPTLAEAREEATRLANLHKGNEYWIFPYFAIPDYTVKAVPKYANIFD